MIVAIFLFRFFGPVHLHAPVATKFGLSRPLLMDRINYRLLVRRNIVNKTLTVLHLDIFQLGKLLSSFLFSVFNLVRHQIIVTQNLKSFLSNGRGARGEASLFRSSFHKHINFWIHVLLCNRRGILDVFFERLMLIVSLKR